MNRGREGPSLAAWTWLADGPRYAIWLKADKPFPEEFKPSCIYKFLEGMEGRMSGPYVGCSKGDGE